MTPSQINEAMRLASLLATARVLHYRARQGSTTFSRRSMEERVFKATQALRMYLEQFATVSDAHTTEGEEK